MGREATGAETAADVRRQRRAARPRARHHAGHIHVQPRRPVQRHQRLRRGEAAVERGGGHAGQVSAILPRVTSAVARNTSLRTARDWKDDAGQSRRDGVRHDVLQHQRVQRGVQVAWRQREAGACVVRARAASRAEHGFHGRARRRHERPRRRRIGWIVIRRRRPREFTAPEDGAAGPDGRPEPRRGRARLLTRRDELTVGAGSRHAAPVGEAHPRRFARGGREASDDEPVPRAARCGG